MIELGFVFFFSLTALFTLRRVAKRIGLVDKPNLRKLHSGEIPLVGGVAVFATISQFIYTNPSLLPHSDLYLICIFVLTFVGVIDDKYDISYKVRLVIQTSLAIAMITLADFELKYVGDILGFGELQFGFLSPLITVLAVIGAINAFNMVDGVDGLLGGLSMVTFTSLAFILKDKAQSDLAFVCIGLVIALIPYVAFNLGWLGKKRRVFMGDAGSMMIGFTVVWLLLASSQIQGSLIIRPVTCLWLIALPLMDMIAVMYRRLKNKRSPFKPDRDHLHHICLSAGFGKYSTLLLICGLSSIFSIIGILGEYFEIPELFMFIGFILTFFTYNNYLNLHWPKQKKVTNEVSKPL